MNETSDLVVLQGARAKGYIFGSKVRTTAEKLNTKVAVVPRAAKSAARGTWDFARGVVDGVRGK